MQIEQLVVGELATNCYFLGSEETKEAIIVDPGGDAPKILARLEGWELQTIVLTHGHFDHFAGLFALLEQKKVPVAIGRGDALALSDPSLSLAAFLGTVPPKFTPDLLLTEGEKIKVGATEFEILETPGHSPGGICLWGAGLLITGDTLFAGSVGRTDFPTSSFTDLAASLEQLKKLPPDLKVLPGHGPTSTLGAELATNPFLR